MSTNKVLFLIILYCFSSSLLAQSNGSTLKYDNTKSDSYPNGFEYLQNTIFEGSDYKNERSIYGLKIGSSVSNLSPSGNVTLKSNLVYGTKHSFAMYPNTTISDVTNVKLFHYTIYNQSVFVDSFFIYRGKKSGLKLNKITLNNNDYNSRYILSMHPLIGEGVLSMERSSYNSDINLTQEQVTIGAAAGKFKLDIDGDILANSFLSSSDKRLKSNILPLSKCSDKILKLNGKILKTELTTHQEASNSDNSRFIISEQDINEMYPELITSDSSGYSFVDYIGLLPLIVETLKEQQEKIDSNQTELDKLKQKSNIYPKTYPSKNIEPKDLNITANRSFEQIQFRVKINTDKCNIRIQLLVFNLAGKILWTHDKTDTSDNFKDYAINWSPSSDSDIYFYKSVININNIEIITDTKKIHFSHHN